MGFRLFTTICLIMIIAVGTRYLTDIGWVPWAVGVSLVALAFIGQGLSARRRRGTQTPLQNEPDIVEGRKVVLGRAEDEAPPPAR